MHPTCVGHLWQGSSINRVGFITRLWKKAACSVSAWFPTGDLSDDSQLYLVLAVIFRDILLMSRILRLMISDIFVIYIICCIWCYLYDWCFSCFAHQRFSLFSACLSCCANFHFQIDHLLTSSRQLTFGWDPCVILRPAYSAVSGSIQHVFACMHSSRQIGILGNR